MEATKKTWYGIWLLVGDGGDWMRDRDSTAVLAFDDSNRAHKVAADEFGYDTYAEANADGWCEVKPLD